MKYLFASLFLFAFIAVPAIAAPLQFEPLNDTLARYKLYKMPEAADYPEVPAVAVLSVTEYKQFNMRHQRTIHKIVKILTPAGKEYTTIKIPCVSACHIQARTIKADGKVVNLPAKDMLRSEKITQYSSPFSLVQFPMPGVEPGDMIEYKAILEYEVPFFLDDFRFAEAFPTTKAFFILSHPSEYSYSYLRHLTKTCPSIEVFRDSYVESQAQFSRTTFVAERIPAALQEPYAPQKQSDVPGVRLLMESRNGRKFEVFQDWWKYGEFIAEQAVVPPIVHASVANFVRQTVGESKQPEGMVKAVYRAADKQISIINRTLPMTGFEFNDADAVLREHAGTPHDFALFLANCFRFLKWNSELVLVNSHQQPDANKNVAFPLDLDLVFLNVKTPAGEFLLDCNKNGLPPGVISSHAMNRFALGIPLQAGGNLYSVNPYASKVPFRNGNRSHFQADAQLSNDRWRIDFRWSLEGELQSDFLRIFRQQGQAALENHIADFLRTRITALEISGTSHRFTSTGIELSGKAVVAARPAGANLELLQNDLWDAGFHIRPYNLENRINRLVLPIAGEIESTYRISMPPANKSLLPPPAQFSSPPLSYSITSSAKAGKIEVNERMHVSDTVVVPASFSKLASFLDAYYNNHFWSVLIQTSIENPVAELNQEK